MCLILRHSASGYNLFFACSFPFICQGVRVSPKLHFMSEAHEHGRKIQIAPQYVVNSEFVASHGGNSFAKAIRFGVWK